VNFDGTIPKYTLKHLISGNVVFSKFADELKYPVLSSEMNNATPVDANFKKIVNKSQLVLIGKNQNKNAFVK